MSVTPDNTLISDFFFLWENDLLFSLKKKITMYTIYMIPKSNYKTQYMKISLASTPIPFTLFFLYVTILISL